MKSKAVGSNKKKRVPLRDVKTSVGNIKKDGNDDHESIPKKPTTAIGTSLSHDGGTKISSTRPMRAKRGTTSKVKYAETTEDEGESSSGRSDDDDDVSSVGHKVAISKKSKGKGAPVNGKKKIQKVAMKDDVSKDEPARISIIRNSSSIAHSSSPLGNSDWRSSFAIDY